jgi:phage-related holin
MKQFLLYLLWSTVAVLAPIKSTMIVVGVLIFVDLLTGMWAAKKRKEIITSAALRRTVSKMLIYQIAVISGFLLDHYILEGSIPVAKLVAGAIGLVEFKSVLENSNTILGVDLFQELIKRLGSKNDAS